MKKNAEEKQKIEAKLEVRKEARKAKQSLVNK